MEEHNVWNSLANFLSSIPKTVSKAASKAASGVSKSLSETSRELFFNKPKDETVETSEDTKDVTGAKPTEIVPTTETPQIEVSPREVNQLSTDISKPVEQKKTTEIKSNEISPKSVSNTNVSDGVPSLDITPDVSPILVKVLKK